jgi:ABC-2 type transport system ATP-binding protein
VIFATHYLEEADAYADRIVFIRRGRVVADGTAAHVKALASGRILRATLPAADRAARPGADRDELADLPGVDSIEVRGDTLIVHSRDTDAVARHLLTRTGARDIEITSRNLEQAFLALTADETDDPAADTGDLTDTGTGTDVPTTADTDRDHSGSLA